MCLCDSDVAFVDNQGSDLFLLAFVDNRGSDLHLMSKIYKSGNGLFSSHHSRLTLSDVIN